MTTSFKNTHVRTFLYVYTHVCTPPRTLISLISSSLHKVEKSIRHELEKSRDQKDYVRRRKVVYELPFALEDLSLMADKGGTRDYTDFLCEKTPKWTRRVSPFYRLGRKGAVT